MPLRPPSGTAGLASFQFLPNCRNNSLFLASRLDGGILVRFNHTSSDPSKQSWSRRPPRSQEQRENRFNKRPQSQNIGLKTKFLGEPGGILVVPGHEHRRRRKNPKVKEQPANDTERENAVPFILSELGKQERTVEDEAVDQRIEAFRSPYPPNAELSNAEWEEVRSKMLSSFTAAQLTGYISEHHARRPLRQTLGGAMEWRPGTSMFLEDDPGSQSGVAHRVVASRSLKGKKLLAERILRDCWHLGVVGEVGQQDIRLPAHWITLFLNSENFSFEEIASLNGAKIDITHALGLVRITGTKNICESISVIIYDATKRIRQDDFEQSPQAEAKFKDAFTPDLLDCLCKWHGVSFTLNSRGFPSKIFYLVENKRGADNARRNLNLVAHRGPSVIPFCTYVSASEPANIYTVDPESKGSYFDRQKTWFRWAMSSTQSTAGTILDTPFFNAHHAHLSDVLLNLLRQDSFATTNKGSTADTRESISAAVGKCLFMRKPSTEDDLISAFELGEMSVPRTFIPDVPKATTFLRSLALCPPEDTQRHRIRLLPTAVNADSFPELELEIAVNETDNPLDRGSELAVRSAKAILSENSVDFLLPENDLDLRFTRKIHYNLLNGSASGTVGDRGIQSLEQTMEKCLRGVISIDSAREPQVPLPEFCHISLPKHLLKRNPTTVAHRDNPDEYVSAEYMFQPVNDARGTQVHRYDFHGQKLNHLFYESGPFFASRTTDLFVDMELPASGQSRTPSNSAGHDPSQNEAASVQRQFNAFYSNACRLAFELDRAWRVS